MELVIVGIIIAVAAGYTIYRFVAKPSCGCGGCSCGNGNAAKKTRESGCGENSCSCGK